MLRGDHGNRGTEMMREQTCSKKCELLPLLSEHLIAFRVETAKFFIVFSSFRKQMKVLAGTQSKHTQKAGIKVPCSG